jgi:hypothetical protein
MFHNKPSFPSHVKVIASFSMCFGRHLVVVVVATHVVASHVVLCLFICFNVYLFVSSCGSMYSNFKDFLQSFLALARFATSKSYLQTLGFCDRLSCNTSWILLQWF